MVLEKFVFYILLVDSLATLLRGGREKFDVYSIYAEHSVIWAARQE